MHAPPLPVHEELGRHRKARLMLIELDRLRIATGISDDRLLDHVERYTSPEWGTLAALVKAGDPSPATREVVLDTLRLRLLPVGM